MSNQISKNPGEVVVNSLEVMTDFEKKCVHILRHANDLFTKDDLSNFESILSKFLIIKSDIDCSIIDCFSNRILILSFVLLFDIKNCKNKTINNKRIII